MLLKKVTITGADGTNGAIVPQDLVLLQRKYPFVEWGILFSNAKIATPRFPSASWLEKLAETKIANPELRLSAHICGRWVRDICEGKWTIKEDLPSIFGNNLFDRYQLNFHSYIHKIEQEKFLVGLKEQVGVEFIFQLDDVNNNLLILAENAGVKAAGLFDTSGGAGVLPDQWPVSDKWIGYAGGLGPECLEAQLKEINEVAQGSIWIDTETKVRTIIGSSEQLDLQKVEKFLQVASKWIDNG